MRLMVARSVQYIYQCLSGRLCIMCTSGVLYTCILLFGVIHQHTSLALNEDEKDWKEPMVHAPLCDRTSSVQTDSI